MSFAARSRVVKSFSLLSLWCSTFLSSCAVFSLSFLSFRLLLGSRLLIFAISALTLVPWELFSVSCASWAVPSQALDRSPVVSLLVTELAGEPPVRAFRVLPLLMMRARVDGDGDGDVDGPEISVNKLDMLD